MKLIEALRILREAPRGAQPFKVSLVCSFTPLHLKTFLAAHLQVLLVDRTIEIDTGLYGDLEANLNRIAGGASEAGVVALEWPDFDPRLGIRQLGGWEPRKLKDILQTAQMRANHLRGMLKDASARLPLAVSFPTLALPPASFTPTWQAGSFELELHRIALDLACWTAAQPNLKVARSEYSRCDLPVNNRFNVQSEVLMDFPYALEFASTLAEALARLVRHRIPQKGLITDLDDTLWSGILGEVGVEGVSWDLDHHSHMHGLYQQVLRALSEEGVLLAVASKNDPALVQKIFKSGRLIVPEKCVFPIEVHWGRKSESVTRILRAWNVAEDSVVFIDDSAMDLAEVKAVHPNIECIKFPNQDYQAIYVLLQRLRDLFGKSALSEEDSIRLCSLRHAETLREQSTDAVSMGRFLEQAEAELTLTFSKTSMDPRALELVNKTNQFNLNGKRYTETEWRAFLDRPDSFLLVAAYKDKYGPLGEIAVLAGRKDSQRVFVEVWVMSCRAFSRQIEYACLARLFEKFQPGETILGFSPTERNGPLRDFLAQFCDLNAHSEVLISAETFAKKCPVLSHRTQELLHE